MTIFPNAPGNVLKSVAVVVAGLALAVAGIVEVSLEPSRAAGQSPPMRFDDVVRDDFFAGLAGDTARLDAAMRRCEEELAKDPRHAQALVWHGSGLMYRAGVAARREDFAAAAELSRRGAREMDDAVSFAPDDTVVLLLRGVTLSAAARGMRDPARAVAALRTAVGDFETTLRIQTPIYARLAEHPRGELLGGLADLWYRLGEEDKARAYLGRLTAELPGSPYADAARQWLAQRPLRGGPALTCVGCHE